MGIKEAIVQIAESVILQRGFNTLSYKDISGRLEIKKATIHEFFPTKDDLGKAVIQKSRHAFRDWSKEIDACELDPTDKLDTFFASYRTLLADGDKICIAGILGAELNTLPKSMQSELRFYYLERQKWLMQLLSDGLYTGVFIFAASPEDEALFILSSLQGGLQIARINDDHDIFFTICRQLKSNLVRNQQAVMYKS